MTTALCTTIVILWALGAVQLWVAYEEHNETRHGRALLGVACLAWPIVTAGAIVRDAAYRLRRR